MAKWTPEELNRRWTSLTEYAEQPMRELIEEVTDPDKARQLAGLLQESCDEIRYDDTGAELSFSALAACVALGETDFDEAVPILFDVGGTDAANALDTAATHALQRFGAPAARRLPDLIDASKNPFTRAFGYTALEACVDVDEETRQRVEEYCLARADTEGRSPKEKKWGCWPALSLCATLVMLRQERVRPTIEWWMTQDCDVESVHWNELLISLDEDPNQGFHAWRDPWPLVCRRLVEEFKEENSQPPGARPAPSVPKKGGKATKVGRNAPCPCGSGKKYKKCCLTP